MPNRNSKVALKKKTFSLDGFKEKKGLNENVKYKEQQWIPLSPAFQETSGLIGFPTGHTTILRGHTDTGKTTALLEAAVACQKMGIVPVLIITELKWSWEHARLMGFEFEEVTDEFGNIVNYKGNFIYVDRSSLNSIEDVAEFILNIIEEQEKGALVDEDGNVLDMCFFWDSVGSIACELCNQSKKHNNEWDAGAISRNFGKGVLPKINMSRKEGCPYTNTLVVITQVWVKKPDSPVGMPKLACKGGDTIPFHASLMITFGNVTNSGVSKLKAVKNKKDVTYASRTKVNIEKNHVNGISTSGKIIATPHGYVMDSPSNAVAKAYFKDNAEYFMGMLGAGDGEVIDLSEILLVSEDGEEEEGNLKVDKSTGEVLEDGDS